MHLPRWTSYNLDKSSGELHLCALDMRNLLSGRLKFAPSPEIGISHGELENFTEKSVLNFPLKLEFLMEN